MIAFAYADGNCDENNFNSVWLNVRGRISAADQSTRKSWKREKISLDSGFLAATSERYPAVISYRG